ncbi:cupin domain-containing protein [Streptomyces sulphureus]|uniref:cupin domain-containing protein n=1 Tax=Streptomyces sulphureus TaxID=47758 RepID=UPI0003798191|nr:cupin domain-containing protein [Streptomyces sulphureus]
MTLAALHAFDDARTVRIGETTTTRFIAPAGATDGRLGIFHHSMLPGASGAAPHYHTRIAESFYVLRGEVALHDGSGWRTAHAGDFLHVPERAVHGFRNDSGALAEMLIIFTPAEHREGFFEGLSRLLADGNRPSREEMVALMEEFDQYEVDPDAAPHHHTHAHHHDHTSPGE